MRLSLRGISATAAAVALVGTMAIGAATPTHAASGPSAVVGAAPARVPNTNIVGRGSHAHYRPATLSVHLTSGSSCTTATEGMSVNNETTASQTVTYSGSPFFSLSPEQAGGICFFVAGTYQFSLSSNPSATLTVTAA